MSVMAETPVRRSRLRRSTGPGTRCVLHWPRFGEEGTHFHTYGLLTPYFNGLTEGRLMATCCVNRACPIGKGEGALWLPPRADCPDCHQIDGLEGGHGSGRATSTPTRTSSAAEPASRSRAPTTRST